MKNIELLNELRQLDEVALIELLELTSDDIVDAFSDLIDDRQNALRRYLNDDK